MPKSPFETCLLACHDAGLFQKDAEQIFHPDAPSLPVLDFYGQVVTSLPITIFIREKALVVHLDALRMIICADQVGTPISCICNKITSAFLKTAHLTEMIKIITNCH
jgi:hypothetical protein